MSAVWEWVKGNVVSVFAGALALASLLALLVVQLQGEGLIARMKGRQEVIDRIEELRRTPVRVPPEDPDGVPQTMNVTVNQTAIDALKHTYERMGTEYDNIFDYAVQINRQGRAQFQHQPILDGLFPEPVDPAKPWEAKTAYRKSFATMLEPHAPNSLMPRLNAGEPLSKEALKETLAKVETEYLATKFGKSTIADLTRKEKAELNQLKREKLIDRLRGHAESIHVYAETDRGASDYPFQVAEWSQPEKNPKIAAIWEGQMSLWIQQDIVASIAKANFVADSDRSVVGAPVKRLIDIEVLSGYVGITTTGALKGARSINRRERVRDREKNEPLPNDFSIAPTGRRSNDIYDVKHARVEAIVDAQRVPRWFDKIAQANFMSILKYELEQVDEYEALRNGYVYGRGDVVRVDLVLESIWLREWTTDLMPKKVKKRIAVPVEDEEGEGGD